MKSYQDRVRQGTTIFKFVSVSLLFGMLLLTAMLPISPVFANFPQPTITDGRFSPTALPAVTPIPRSLDPESFLGGTSSLEVNHTSNSSKSGWTRGIGYVPNQFIVRFTAEATSGLKIQRLADGTVSTSLTGVDELIRIHKITGIEPLFPGRQLGKGGEKLRQYYRVTFENPDTRPEKLNAVMDAFRENTNIDKVEKIGIHLIDRVPNDPEYGSQWYLHQSSDHDIDAPEAWDITTGDSSVVIAVVDTGVLITHPDLIAKVWENPGEGGVTNGVDDDGNGYIDDIMGWDFVSERYNLIYQWWPGEDGDTADNSPMDFNGHGTHVAGIAAADTNNSLGVAGIDWNAQIMALRVGGSLNYWGHEIGVVRMDWCAQAINYATNISVRDGNFVIINTSWESSDTGGLGAATDYAINNGILIIHAAGNNNSNSADYLASRNDVLTVAATNGNDQKASFSNYGTWVDVSAPGWWIYSTYSNHYEATYEYLDGTSMASPIVAGIAALVKSAYPNWGRQQIFDRIISTADNIDYLNPGYEGRLGSGRVNAFEAVKDDDTEGPTYSNLETIPSDPVADSYNNYIRVQGDVYDPSGIYSVKFMHGYGGLADIYTNPSGQNVDSEGNGPYWYDIPRSEWVDHIGDRISWRIWAYDDDSDRPNDRSDSHSEWGPQIYLYDDDTSGPTITDHWDSGDAPPGTYYFKVKLSDPSGILDDTQYPRIYYRWDNNQIDDSHYDGYIDADWDGSWYVASLNVGSEKCGRTIYWRALTYDNDTDRDNDRSFTWSSVYHGGTITCPKHMISGYVRTSGGSGISGVVMNGLPGNPSTNSSGYYSAEVEHGWSGTVTPQKSGWTFDPPSRSYSNVTSDQTNQNYTGTPGAHTISGYVRTSGGSGISGVVMSGLPGNPTTNTSGYYSAEVEHGWSGTVTPQKSGWTFDPPSRSYSNVTSDQTNQNYTGTPQTYTISGYVRTSGSAGIGGVVMNGLPGNPSTNSSGYYSAQVEHGWSGTVTPQKAGWTFDPPSRSYSNVTSDQTNQNYTGTVGGVPNDLCTNAIVIPSSGPFPYTNSQDTTQATTSADDPDQGCGQGVNSNSVWYTFTPDTNGFIDVETCGSDYDTVLSIFDGTCGSFGSSLACNDDACDLQSQILGFPVSAGTTYYIEITDYGSSPGGGTLNLTLDYYTSYGISLEVRNQAGNPAANAQVEAYSDTSAPPDFRGNTDASGSVWIDVPGGTYTLVVSSRPDHFILVKQNVTAPSSLTLDTTGTAVVDVEAKKLDGTPLDAAIYLAPYFWNLGDVGSTDANGHLTFNATPMTYHVFAWGWFELYYLVQPNVTISGPTTLTFHAADMDTGDISVDLLDFAQTRFIPWGSYSVWAPVLTTNDGDTVVFSADSYAILLELLKTDATGDEWYYWDEPTGNPYLVSLGSSTTIHAGGDFTACTMPDKSFYNAGNDVNIGNFFTDAFGNAITWIEKYTPGQGVLGKPGTRETVSLDRKRFPRGKQPLKGEVQASGWSDVCPTIVIKDPNNQTIANENSCGLWWGYQFTLSSSATRGIYSIDLSLDTGPHQGVVEVNGHFTVNCIFGDVNCNCEVGVDDVQQVASRWRTSCAKPDPDNNLDTPNYDPLYDINKDGVINIVDIMLVVAHWGEICF